MGNCVVQDEEIGMLLSAKNNERFIHENPQYSINKLLVLLDERLRTRIKLKTMHHEDERMYGRKLAEYKNYLAVISIREVCLRFMSTFWTAMVHPIILI